MIAGIIIYLVLGALYSIYLDTDKSHNIAKKYKIIKLHILLLYLFIPIIAIHYFYYWNFIDCEQYGIKK